MPAGLPAGRRRYNFGCVERVIWRIEHVLLFLYRTISKEPVHVSRSHADPDARRVDQSRRAAVSAAGTTMIIVNSVCGCAAGRMRPAVRMALQHSAKPDHVYSVFAGQDKDATERARSYFTGYPPSSPSIGILRDGKLIYMMQRSQIETREAPAIAADLASTFDQLSATTKA
jgi:putative YphP/YqiW family bacilliredoxin